MAESEERFQRTSLATIANGAVAEQFQYELMRILANCDDLNTPAKETRKLTIEFSFTPDGSRQAIETVIAMKAKLCGPKASETVVFVVRDQHGEVFAVDHNPHQPDLFRG
jgi:hypothetical protein